MELVCMDFLSVEPDSKNMKDILVITDHFTKYAVAIPTRNQKATTVAKCLWEQFLVHYGFPERLHSDQGRDFESQTIKELCSLLGIHKVRTSPYHPRGNPVERYNRTLLGMLGTLKDTEKRHWCDYVKPLTHAYNCTRNDVTGFSPYQLMFGRQPRLPIDIAFGLPQINKQSISHSQYVKQLKNHLEDSYKIAIKNSQKVADRNKKRFDKVIRESTLDVGDRVLVRNLRLRDKHKLADKWEQTVYVVTKQKENLPVYTVTPEKGDGPPRTLHRDLLLPCGFLAPTEDEPQQMIKPRKPQTRQSSFQPDNDSLVEEEDNDFGLEINSPQITERHFFQIYDYPIMPGNQTNKEPAGEHCLQSTGSETLEQTEKVPSENNLSETSTGDNQTSKSSLTDEQRQATNSPVMNSEPETNLTETEKGTGTHLLNTGTDHSESETLQIDSQESLQLRRSERDRQPSRRLHYAELGNPMLTVVKSLFQGLTQAMTDSLAPDTDHGRVAMYRDVHDI
ncbi:uncharacterized protein LOC115798655 [Archocentrus centrarchus]|uniref:uncharacterized protein LOC115798655 n=1 Tax=Archocentrus centrarchus TaxID=63155 RepID=UPI0011EA40A6|nr:uncharacterized protein LOC115798655 [Archocentrus centrarchus]XP_030611440.1 uncharacterized protein LOC115798655 [Archocentrus centrarchus]